MLGPRASWGTRQWGSWQGSPDTDIREVPTPDIKNNIKKRIAESWQSEWDIYSFKLKAIKDTVHPWNTSSRRDWREEVVTRLRIEHCHFGHGCVLRGEHQPICQKCSVPMSVENVLVNCAIFQSSRQKHQLRGGLHEIFGNNNEGIARLLSFLRDSGLYKIILF
jgi:hypothetical protein